jgi:hypothetical protein
VKDYRVSYVDGKVPYWRIENGRSVDIALTADDVMAQIGQMLESSYDPLGDGRFRVLWDKVPDGFSAPDLNLILSEEPTASH